MLSRLLFEENVAASKVVKGNVLSKGFFALQRKALVNFTPLVQCIPFNIALGIPLLEQDVLTSRYKLRTFRREVSRFLKHPAKQRQ
jgi:hypothetical protein